MMNKKERNIIDIRLQKYLNPYLDKKGYSLDKTLFCYVNNDFTISWGDIADCDIWLTFKPYFKIYNGKTVQILNDVFNRKKPVLTSSRVQSTTHFAHEFGVYDFDDSEFNSCSDGICSYGYRICLEEEDAKVLEGIPILCNVEPIVQDHIQFLEKVAFPYFERLSTVEGINDYFNTRVLSLTEEEFQDIMVIKSFQKEEVLSAIVASYLTKDNNLEEIISRYKKLYLISENYSNDINILSNWIAEHPNL